MFVMCGTRPYRRCIIITGIFVKRNRIWKKSRKLLVEALGGYYNEDSPSIILNFGNDHPSISREPRILNQHISIIQDKETMNHILDDTGCPHPKTFYYPFANLPKNNEECVIKARFSERGKDITFTTYDKVPSNISRNYYIQRYVPFEREYRVGVDWKRVLGVREKIGDYKIRNSATCEYITRDLPILEHFTKDIVELFGIHFCGVDIGEYNGTYYIIELNSAPTIGKAWARKLKNDLVSLL